MNKKTVFAMAAVCAWLAAACVTSGAGGARTMQSSHTLHYVHLYSGASGVSHFRDETPTLRSDGRGVGDSRALSAPEALIALAVPAPAG